MAVSKAVLHFMKNDSGEWRVTAEWRGGIYSQAWGFGNKEDARKSLLSWLKKCKKRQIVYETEEVEI